ncbi:MAG: dTDP-4-dehydrorhamnose 3,5-epimerase family protein, partial [Desulfococcaceae bacterium]
MPFNFYKTELPEVIIIEPKVFKDERGFFMESFKSSDFWANGINVNFLQDNHSKSSKNIIRGLHYQKAPKAQAKLVRCTKGKIFDIAVDLRPDSKYFGKWTG